MNTILYIATKSNSRKLLLERSGIPFEIIEQNADETKCGVGLPLPQLVEAITLCKMDHAILPAGKEGQTIFVLTADTLSLDNLGTIRGKPADLKEAREMLKAACGPNNICGTALCLDKKVFKNNEWQTQRRIIRYAQAQYSFDIPESMIDSYVQRNDALQAAGAIKIENGAQFVKKIDGSYSAIVGLPMYELRLALEELGFYK